MKSPVPDSLLATIVRHAMDAIYSCDLDGRFTSWNAGAERLYGYSEAEALGQPVSLIAPPARRHEQSEALARLLAGEALPRFETERMRKDGKRLEVCMTAAPIRDAGGAIVGTAAIAQDVTEQRSADSFARKLHRAVEQASNVIITTDSGGLLSYVNPAFERVYGYAAADAIGKTPRLIKSGRHDAAFYRDFWAALLSGAGFRGEMVNQARDGHLVTVEVSANAIFDSGGRILGFFSVQNDVTEKKLLEAEFIQAQKMEAVGRLAGGIAHDFNNLLTAILGYSDLLVTRLAANGLEREQAIEIRKAAERAAGLTFQLLAFSRKQVVSFELVNLNDAIRDAQKMLERVIGENIEIRAALDPNLDLVQADRGQIGQVLMNLAVNARDAMPGGGVLTIETENILVDPAFLADQIDPVAPGAYVRVTFSDTGIGMDDSTRARVFEPFFTTKEVGKGTGLGLSTAYGIVKHSGGFMWVYSEPGRGATFKIYLPRAEAKDRAEQSLSDATSIVAGTGSILLVEDDDAVRGLLRTSLESAGYAVLVAARPHAALAIARDRVEPIQLLLTDTVMPGMSGPDLAVEIARMHPETRIIFMSGYASSHVFRPDLLPPDSQFLQKPFSPATLTRKIREVLGARSGS